MKIIGLTGGFKTGKSTVLRIFKELGSNIIDADILAHKVLEESKEIFKKVIENFGEGILNKRGEIDRIKLAKVVFNCKHKLKTLNDIIHPEVIKELKNQVTRLKKNNPEAVLVIEVPLLFETHLANMMDKIIVVSLTYDKQLKRAKEATFLSDKEIDKRIKSQMPLNKKEELAGIIINNNGSLKEIKKQVKNIWKKIKE